MPYYNSFIFSPLGSEVTSDDYSRVKLTSLGCHSAYRFDIEDATQKLKYSSVYSRSVNLSCEHRNKTFLDFGYTYNPSSWWHSSFFNASQLPALKIFDLIILVPCRLRNACTNTIARANTARRNGEMGVNASLHCSLHNLLQAQFRARDICAGKTFLATYTGNGISGCRSDNRDRLWSHGARARACCVSTQVLSHTYRLDNYIVLCPI